ncbi:MAG: UDP-3-O-acyl-N-acetylglucosamine deacetylase [bacterium]
MNEKYIITGKCLHSGYGHVEISPAQRFVLNSYQNGKPAKKILLNLDKIAVKNHTINIDNEIKVIEHLFSALYGLDIFKAQIDFYSNEVPIFDGSSRDFVNILHNYPKLNHSKIFCLDKKICCFENSSYIIYEPERTDHLIINMVLEHPYIGTQEIELIIDKNNYIKEIAPARTFVFTDENDPRLKNLPPYGIGITPKAIYSAEPLRFPDEPVRHKILDLLGDLYLIQRKIGGRINAKNTYHRLNLKFAKELKKSILCGRRHYILHR